MSEWNSDYLMGYSVRYKLEEDPDTMWHYSITQNVECLVDNLLQGRKYMSNVQASNLYGGGPWSKPGFGYVDIGIFS